jgi:hypothetical protein
MQYFGITLFMGSVMALVFTILFWILVGMLASTVLVGLGTFGLLMVLGYTIVKFKWEDWSETIQ